MAAAAESASAPHSIYAQMDGYPWDIDAEFQSGLGAILGSSPSPEQAVELTLRARCFYYSRKFDVPVDFDVYKAYRAQASSPSPVNTTATNGISALPTEVSTPTSISDSAAAPDSDSAPAASSSAAQPEAPYPTSFAHIVELITTGRPIPGIKEIPATVLEGQGTQSTASKRKKPWERDVGVAAGMEQATASTGAGLREGTGSES